MSLQKGHWADLKEKEATMPPRSRGREEQRLLGRNGIGRFTECCGVILALKVSEGSETACPNLFPVPPHTHYMSLGK